ncbi:VWA domain-containing protein [Candidatus Poseidoniales archaeon]|nr:VWA domain-containing protein [Candidatus Poseidoniales archaeon]MDB2320091.1 VWA domain-containing protein [Candidatus Poseidoniales archaeon]MDB2580952.1 VWA domain-containing protein [Candidatus Poseidoniales archaeon]
MTDGGRIDCQVTFGINGIMADKSNSSAFGFLRLKGIDRAVTLPNHVILILDLSLSMANNIDALTESIHRIVNRLEKNRDKVSIIGFGGVAKTFVDYVTVNEMLSTFEKLNTEISTLKGTTDFNAGLGMALNLIERRKQDFPPGSMRVGNMNMDWDGHNHIAIFMTDGKNYGNVPWDSVEKISKSSVTLHTVGISKSIDKKVRKTLLKMAHLGGGGFNFSRTIFDFHEKVKTLLDLSLNAVTKPGILSLVARPGVIIENANLLGHPEQDTESASPEFVFPAMTKTDRKFVLFNLRISEAHHKNTRIDLFDATMSPDYLQNGSETATITVVPKMPYLESVKRGPNADWVVHSLTRKIEIDIHSALEESQRTDDISMFKMNVKDCLEQAIVRIHKQMAKHPKQTFLLEKINYLSEQISASDTIQDPKEFFSSIAALMRTTR